jgi:hypothetical protein
MQQVLANVFVAFSEMKEFNKRKRTEFIAATVPQIVQLLLKIC